MASHHSPEDDVDRATVLWRAGLSLIDAGKLEWAEDLATTERRYFFERRHFAFVYQFLSESFGGFLDDLF